MDRAIAGLFWIFAYLAVVLSPLFVMLVRPTPPVRPFLVEVSLGLGFVGLVQIAVQFALIARFRRVTAPYGIDLVLKYHRQIALIAITLIALHPVILVIDNPALLTLLNPVGGTWASRTGNWALYLLILLAALTLTRKPVGLRYEIWRVSHAFLGIGALALAHVHVHLAGYYTATLWKELLLLAISALMLSFFGYLRLVKPLQLLKEPYRVTEIRPEGGKTWTLALSPEDRSALRFRPGQFAWLKVANSPYAVEEHPFSFSSSAQERGRLEFGIKELGDFTRRVGNIPLGARAYVDGPHGSFSPDFAQAPGYVFVAGGIGIAPFMSILRTMADRGDKRPVLLFYAARSAEEMAFRESLEGLATRLDLTVVYILEVPPSDWDGEVGLIDARLLERHLPIEGIERFYFICGPNPMMDAVTRALSRCRVPPHLIHSERFDLA